MASSNTPFRVGIVLIPGFALMSYAATVEPIRAANLLSRELLYQITHIKAEPGEAVSSGHIAIKSEVTMEPDAKFDLVLVIAGGNAMAYENKQLVNWLRRLSRKGVPIGGVSAGPVFLAQNGLLNNRRMTVHWEHVALLQETMPSILLEHSLYVIDRDRMTCGGGTAPIDLMLAIIANHHGQKLAQLVGDWFLHTSIRPSAGPQRASLAERYGTANGAVLAAIEAIETHVANPLSLSQIAGIAGVSPRQLSRLFSATLDRTPMEFAKQMRLEKARKLLVSAPLSISEIALMTGFSSAAHFSTAFAAHFGEPPSAIRR